ncbi:CtsR family transcriptional regulator [Kurthia sibirica]|uniref:Transcriptional regulator CtsR n=1 Tax=Kurthia sibirica TaxID=202750 RepID=A0A2U3AMA6_9BACL|nr:CtsR family transcriptional regulator [Kurthia sibirica]PWI25655.1 CtsR family transcriptional regulator [Kurthia sibirica]GEK35476.1 transcriptional regulator CtsR [Kurthia sibirica]
MKNISNIIENYLKEVIESEGRGLIEIKRSEIADRFQCVPSQINYVINTRFTIERGYHVESKRGGGGYIRILRVRASSKAHLIEEILKHIGDEVSQIATEDIVFRLIDEQVISKREAKMILAAVDRQVIAIELPYRDQLRARILSAILMTIMYENES